MARRHKTPAVNRAAAFGPDFISDLRAKYLELTRKYTVLVRRLEARTAETVGRRTGLSSVYRLGYWALHVSRDALAVVQNGVITNRNARWHELDGAAGGWVGEGADGSATYQSLSEMAVDASSDLPTNPAALLLRRFRSAEGKRVVEARIERLGSLAAPVVMLVHDVTEQVEAEQELLQTREALFQSERLGILGELASSIAHELGNTLRALGTRVEVLSLQPAVMATNATLVEGLRESADAAMESVRKLHDLARAGEVRPGPVDLPDVLRHAVEVLRLRQALAAPAIDVRVQMPDLPPVLGTNSELSHLFVTLLFNARDAMPAGGTIEVRAERVQDRVRVIVDDQGTGIAPEHVPHLFQPFFTTKGTAGTGLGLWLAHSTMRRLGGKITAHNRAVGGAEFVVEFQVAADGPGVTRDRAAARRRGSSARRP